VSPAVRERPRCSAARPASLRGLDVSPRLPGLPGLCAWRLRFASDHGAARLDRRACADSTCRRGCLARGSPLDPLRLAPLRGRCFDGRGAAMTVCSPHASPPGSALGTELSKGDPLAGAPRRRVECAGSRRAALHRRSLREGAGATRRVLGRCRERAPPRRRVECAGSRRAALHRRSLREAAGAARRVLGRCRERAGGNGGTGSVTTSLLSSEVGDPGHPDRVGSSEVVSDPQPPASGARR
jgi:hypothetical protein